MKQILHGGPLDGAEPEVPEPPWPWLKIMIQDIPVFPAEVKFLPVALYRLVRSPDGRLSYEYEGMQ